MGISTWQNITSGMREATHRAYMRKSSRQRNKREVAEAWANFQEFCYDMEQKLASGIYKIGDYRHYKLQDRKKERDISVLPFRDRCVQNDIKDAIEPLLLKHITDDMMGGLPKRGVVASEHLYCVVSRVRKAMNDDSLQWFMQGDIRKFYDSIDNVTTMRLVERYITDNRTLNVIRQHLFNQKRLAIGDPFSHLLANLNMSVIIRKAKEKYGKRIIIINFADDVLVFSKEKETLAELRTDLRKWAKELRLKYKPMYIRKKDVERKIRFCGYIFGKGFVHLTKETKKKYIKARHRKRSMGAYNGLLQVADTKNLRTLIELNDNRHMAEKIRRPFAGLKKKVEMLEGISHTIVAIEEKKSWQSNSESKSYMHVQAIADSLGLIVYTTSSKQMVKYLKENTIPMRDLKIVHDYSGYYYEGTVYTDAEEEEMIRKQFNIPKA